MSHSPSNLIINYLPQSMTERELYSMFVTIGPIEKCQVMKDHKTGYSYGFGFVKYINPEDAVMAIKLLNGQEIFNKRIKVSYARPSTGDIKETNLYVTNLPRSFTEENLVNLFGQYGIIVQKRLLLDKYTKMSRRVAFVRYEKREEARDAIRNLDGHIPEGCNEALSVRVAEEHGKQRMAFYAGWQAGIQHNRDMTFRGRNGGRPIHGRGARWTVPSACPRARPYFSPPTALRQLQAQISPWLPCTAMLQHHTNYPSSTQNYSTAFSAPFTQMWGGTGPRMTEGSGPHHPGTFQGT